MLRRLWVVLSFPVMSLALTSHTLAYDLNNGRLLASNCTQCHATNALPKSAGYDSLVGKSYYDIYGELKEMAQKFNASTHACTESDPKECLMAVHAKPYTDQEMQDIAWYLSQP